MGGAPKTIGSSGDSNQSLGGLEEHHLIGTFHMENLANYIIHMIKWGNEGLVPGYH